MPKEKDKIEKFPGGWNRILRTRHSGSTVGDKDIYIISPLGKKLRSTYNLAKHIENENLFSTVDPNVVNFEKPGQPRKKITKDFIQWLESGGKTKPKFMQERPKKQIASGIKPKQELNINFIKCKQCEFYYSKHQIIVQQNGENLCEGCLIGRTDPYKVLKLFNERNQFLPLENDAIRLQKQTGLPFGEITLWFTNEMQRISNDVDGIPDFEDDIKTETDSMSDTKDSLNSLPKNNEIVRKRRPINFSMEDLNQHDSEDENWDRDPSSSGSGGTKTRTMPRRDASSKIRFDEYFDKVQEEYQDVPQETFERGQNTIPSVEASQIQGGLVEVDNQFYVIKNEEALDDTLEEDSQNQDETREDSEMQQNMVIKEEPLEENNQINETDQGCSFFSSDEEIRFQPVMAKEEPFENVDIKMEIKEEVIEEDDDDIPSDIDIPDDIG